MVDELVEDCLRHANEDAALRRHFASSFARLKERLATLPPSQRAHVAAPEGHAQL
jgi:hypothetical protein